MSDAGTPDSLARFKRRVCEVSSKQSFKNQPASDLLIETNETNEGLPSSGRTKSLFPLLSSIGLVPWILQMDENYSGTSFLVSCSH
jgi:hypothetical protein